jgi:MoxR-like ATPase
VTTAKQPDPLPLAAPQDLSPREAGERAAAVLAEIRTAVVGKPEPLALVMLGILAGGHVLIEDLPGLGKTLLARSFATTLGLDFRRIQFTPDLLPSDVTGAPFYDQRSGEMVFGPAPSSRTCCSRTRSTAPRPRPRRPCWRRWPSRRCPWTAPPGRCPTPSW